MSGRKSRWYFWASIMVQSKKIVVAGWLMASSIVLLILFQAYWLRKTYRDEFFSLRRELGVVLREATMRRQFQQMVWSGNNNRMVFRTDSMRQGSVVIGTSRPGTDSVKNDSMRFEVRIGVPIDSGNGQRPARIISVEGDRRNDAPESTRDLIVTVPYFDDSVNLESLDSIYKKALDENNLALGYSLSQMSKQQVDSMIHHEPMRMNMMRRRGGSSLPMTMLLVKFENPFFHLLSKMGGPVFFSILMLGITIAAFLFLYRSLKAQHRLAVLKSDFISNITHELKTPIATVGVAIEALKNFNAMNDPQRTREYLDISGNELHRLGLLVDKVLRLSMFEQDKMELRKEAVDIEQLVQEVLQSMKLQFEKAGAVVDLKTEATNATVQGDRLHLLSVLYNLIDNALKYCKGKPVIQIQLQQQANTLLIAVQDNGIGIPAEYRTKVFDKFFRVPHGDTHNIKGYGLGLSYVAEVVHKHGGAIEVQAGPAGGSIFVVTLPLSPIGA
jgi:two-component system, OmpR family, phosphate regulon sensor histidine kinase PhoR